MAVLLALAMLMLAMTGHAKCTWCVCKDMQESVLQKTLDYACGAGADCVPTHQNGPCFLPNNVRAHCSYAVNSYYQKKGQAHGSCDFSGTAVISATDPSYAGCSYPATVSAAGPSTRTPVTGTPTPITPNPSTTTPSTTTPSTTTPSTTTPSTTTPSTTTPSTTTPSTTTPSTTTPTTTTPYTTTPNGVLGGIGNGVGPSGAGINTDISASGSKLQNHNFFPFFEILLVLGSMHLWG